MHSRLYVPLFSCFCSAQSSSFCRLLRLSVWEASERGVCLSGCHFAHFASRSAFSRSLFGLAAETSTLFYSPVVCLLFALSVVAIICQSALPAHSSQSNMDHYFPASSRIFLPLPYKSPSHLPNTPWSQHLADETCPLVTATTGNKRTHDRWFYYCC